MELQRRPCAPIGVSEVVRLIERIAPDVPVIDVTYPYCELQQHYDTAILAKNNPSGLSIVEDEFLGRFSQFGGRKSIADLNSVNSTYHYRPWPVLYITSELFLAREVTSLLISSLIIVRLQNRGSFNDVLYKLIDLTYFVVKLWDGASEEVFLFAAPLEKQEFLSQLIFGAKTFALDLRVDQLSTSIGDVSLLDVSLPRRSLMPGRMIPPRLFIHDGANNCEGDDSYSWLWVGEEKKIRVLLGRLPLGSCKLRVQLAKVTHPSNLQGAVLLHNGLARTTKVETWSTDSGALNIELFVTDNHYQILTLALPVCSGTDGDGVMRAACIDMIEIT